MGKRAVAFQLIVTFTFTQIFLPAPARAEAHQVPRPLAVPEQPAPARAEAHQVPRPLAVPEQPAPARAAEVAFIPSELGTLDAMEMSGGPFLFHLQTAHGVYSAQKKIQALLHHLRKKYGIDLVLVEGAGVKLDPELDRYFPNAEWNRKIADLKAKRSLTTGVGLFLLDAIQDRKKIDAHGIESIEAYRKNRKSFQTVLREREKIAPLLSHFDRELQKVFTAALSRPLRDFLLREAAFEEKGMSVLAWFRELRAQAVKELGINLNQVGYQRKWPNLVRLARLQKIESSLDKEKVEKEKGRFLADVKRNLTPELFEDLKSLLSKPGALPYAHVRFLLERVVDRLPPAFSFDRYPNLKAELQLLVFQNEIQPASFLAELELLTSRIRNHLAKTEKEKRTISLFEDDQFLKRVFAFELTPKDYASPRLKRNLIRPSRLAERAGLRKDSLKPESLDHYFEAALEFYRGVKEREQWMVKNIEARLAERPSRAAVVITGGFHTEGLKEAFREKGFSYALISPKIEEVETREDYFNTFLEKTPPSFSFSEIEDVDALPVPLRDLRRHGGSPRFVLRSEEQAIQEFLRRGPGLDFLPKITGGRPVFKRLRKGRSRAEARASDIFKILILDQPKKEDQIQNLAHQFPGKVKVVSRIKLTEEALRSVLQDEDWDVVFIRSDTKAFKKPEFLKLLYQGKSGGERIRPPFILRGGSDMDIQPEDALMEKVHLVRSHGNQYSVRDLFFYFLRGFLRKTQPQIFESRVTDSLESFLWSSLIGIKPEEYLEADKKSQRGKMTEGQKEFLFSGLDATPKQATLRGLGDLKIGFVGLGVIPTVINRRLLALSKVSGVEIKRTAFSPSLQDPSRDGGKARLKAERLQVKPRSLEQIVQEANVISLHVPEREGEILKTEHLDLLAKRTGPIALINTSRQVAVNLEALKKALRAKPDLFYFADNALLKTLKDGTQAPIQELEELRSEFPDRVFITPHIAASTEAAGEGVQRNTVASLQEMLRIAFGEVEISQENRIPRAEVRNSEQVKNDFKKALLDVLNAHRKHTDVRSFIESSEVGGLLNFLQKLGTGDLSLPEPFPDLLPLRSLARQLDAATKQGAKPENYHFMEREILELIKQVVPDAEIPVPISERKFATPIPRPSVKKSRAPSAASAAVEPVTAPVAAERSLMEEVPHSAGTVYRYSGFEGQIIITTDKKLADVLPLVRENRKIPEDRQALNLQRTSGNGEVRIANVITAGKKKAISYVSSAAYGSTPQVPKYAQPIIQKTGASEYSVGLQVVSELTNEKFIISSYVFARDGKILSGNPEPSNMEVARKFPPKEIPKPTYVVGKEIIYSLAHGRVPPQLRRITQEGLEKVGWSGLFGDRKVSFWRTDVFITKLDNYEKPILTLDPAPWLLPQGSNAVPPWVATLWTQEEEVVTPQGDKVMRPEIPFNSIVLYSDENLTDTIKAGFLRERPIIDGQKRRGSFLSGRTGFDKVKGEIARGERTFHNTFKVLWNIYWLAGGTDRTPHDDALTVKAGYDEYLFWFAEDTIKIHLGSEFVKGETLRSWISLPPIAPDARGVRYQNFKDGKLAAEKYFVLFQNSKFQKPQEINRDLVEENKIITPQETIAPFEWKSVKDFYPSLSVEERFLMVRERQKLFSKMRELDRQMEAASLLNSSGRLSQYEKLLQPYRELERLANDLVAVQVSGDFTGREYLKDRLHFPRTPAPDSSKIHRGPQNQQLFGRLVAQVINGEAAQKTFEELERSFGFSEVNGQKIFHAVELPVSQHHREGGKRVYPAKKGVKAGIGASNQPPWINLGSYQKSSIVLTAQTEQKADGKIYLRIRLYDPDRMSEPWDSAYYDYGKKRFIRSGQEWKNYFAGERSLGPPQDMTAAHMTETGGRLYLFPPVRFGSDNETAQKFFGYVELGPNFYEEVDHHGFYPFGTKGSGKRFWAKVSEQDRKILVTIYGTPEMNPESQIQVSEWKAGDPGWRQNKENTSGFEPLNDNVVSEMKGYSSESQRRILFRSWLAGKVPDYLELTLPERILARSKVSLPAPLGTLQGSAKMTVSGADLGTPVSLRTVTETIANDPTTAIDVYDQTGNHHSRAFYSEERPEGINAFLESIRRFKNFQRSLKDRQKDIPEPLLYLKTSAKMSPDLELLDRGRGEGKGRGTNVFLNALNDIDQAGFAKTIEWEHVWLEFGVVEEATGIFPAMYLIPLDQKNRKAVFGLRVVDLGAGQFRYDLPKTYHDLSSEVIPRIEERGYFRNLNGIVYPEIIRRRVEFLQNKTSPAAFFEFLNKLVERKSDASGYVEKTQEVTLHEGKNSIVLEETVADGKKLLRFQNPKDTILPRIPLIFQGRGKEGRYPLSPETSVTQEISIMLDTEAPVENRIELQESISIPEITKQKEPSIEQELPRAPPEAVQNQVSHSVWPDEFNQLDRILFISIPAIPNYQERLDLLRALKASPEDPDFQNQLKKLKDQFLILPTTYGTVSQNMPSIEPTHVLPEPDLGKLWEDFRISIKSFGESIRPTPVLIYRPADYPWDQAREGKIFMSELQKQIKAIQTSNLGMTYFWVEMAPAFHDAGTQRPLRPAFYVVGLNVEKGTASPVYRFLEKGKNKFVKSELNIFGNDGAFTHPVYESARQFGYGFPGQEVDFASIVSSRLELINQLIAIEEIEAWENVQGIDNFIQLGLLQNLRLTRRAQGADSLPKSERIQARHSTGFSSFEIPFFLRSHNLSELFWYAHQIVTQETASPEAIGNFLKTIASNKILSFAFGRQTFLLNPFKFLWSEVQEGKDITMHQDLVRAFAGQVDQLREAWQIPLVAPAPSKGFKEEPLPIEPAEERASVVTESIPAPQPELKPEPEPVPPPQVLSREERIALERAQDLELAKTDPHEAFQNAQSYFEEIQVLTDAGKTEEAADLLGYTLDLMFALDDSLSSFNSEEQATYYYLVSQMLQQSGARLKDVLEFANRAVEALRETSPPALRTEIITWRQNLEVRKKTETIQNLIDQFRSAESVTEKDSLIEKLEALDHGHFIVRKWRFERSVKRDIQGISNQIDHDEMPKVQTYTKTFFKIKNSIQRYFENFHDNQVHRELITELNQAESNLTEKTLDRQISALEANIDQYGVNQETHESELNEISNRIAGKRRWLIREAEQRLAARLLGIKQTIDSGKHRSEARERNKKITIEDKELSELPEASNSPGVEPGSANERLTKMNRRRPVPLDRPRSIFRLANETLSRILLREDNIQFPVQIPEAIAAPAEGRLGEIRQQTLAKLPAVRIRDFLPGRARTSVGLLVTLDAFKRLGPVLEAMAHDNPDLRVAVIGRGDIEEIAIQRKIVQELDPRFSVAENAETALSHLRMKRVSYIEGVGLDEVTAARLREIAPFKTRPESELQAYGASLGLHSLLEQFSAAFERALETAA